MVSTYQSIQHHITHCTQDVRICTWVLAEKGIVSILGQGNEDNKEGEAKEWGFYWKDDQLWDDGNNYTLYNHTQQYPYAFRGNLQSCLAYNIKLQEQTRNPDANANYTNLQTQIFTPSLTPSASTLIKIPDLFTSTEKKYMRILSARNRGKGIPLTQQEVNLYPIMNHLQSLHVDFKNLQDAYEKYLGKWLENTELLARSWMSTIGQISILVDGFERVVKERDERRWWGGNKGGLWGMRKGYWDGRMGVRMMREMGVRHWVQMRYMRYVIGEIIREGVGLKKRLMDIERKVIRLGVLGGVLSREIGKMEEEEVEARARGWLGSLYRFMKRSDGGMEKEKGGKKRKKYNAEESLMEELIRELSRLEEEVEGKVDEMNGIIGAWRKFEKRESVGVGCWFPGVLRGYDGEY